MRKSYSWRKLDFRLRADSYCKVNERATLTDKFLKTALEKDVVAALVFDARKRRLKKRLPKAVIGKNRTN